MLSIFPHSPKPARTKVRIMSLSSHKTTVGPGAAVAVLVIATTLTICGVCVAQKRSRARLAAVKRLLLQGATGKVLDLREEASFARARIRGSHNIPLHSLLEENRWYELPEQHEPLLVLLPPYSEEGHVSLTKEIRGRRATGATTALVANEDLFAMARDKGVLDEGPEQSSSKGTEKQTLSSTSSIPSLSSTLFTPSPFLTRAATAIEPHLRHAWLPLTCIDIGCGAGRDAVWLARRDWMVTAIDCWNQALQKTRMLASRNGVSNRVEVLRGKVKHTGEMHLWMEPKAAEIAPDVSEDETAVQNPPESNETAALEPAGSEAVCGETKKNVEETLPNPVPILEAITSKTDGPESESDIPDPASFEASDKECVHPESGRMDSIAAEGEGCSDETTKAPPATTERVIDQWTPASEFETYGLVVAIRFLERSAFDTLARLVDPRGGYLLLSTFIEEERETRLESRGEQMERTGTGADNGVGNTAKSVTNERGAVRRRRRKGLGDSGDSFDPLSPRASASLLSSGESPGRRRTGSSPSLDTAYRREDDDIHGVGVDPNASGHATDKEDNGGHLRDLKEDRGKGRMEHNHESDDDDGNSSIAVEGERCSGSEGAERHPLGVEGLEADDKPKFIQVGGSVAAARGTQERRVPARKDPNSTKKGKGKQKRQSAAAAMPRWPHDSPKDPKKILRRGELARHFGDHHGFEVLEDSIERLPDGRPIACFLARRLPLMISSPSSGSNASSVTSSWRDTSNRALDRLLQGQQQEDKFDQSLTLHEDEDMASYPVAPVAAATTASMRLPSTSSFRYSYNESRSPAVGFPDISSAFVDLEDYGEIDK